MCGITGLVGKTDTLAIQAILDRAQKTQLHRGPDSQGSWLAAVAGWQVGLGHQRLSILDLSPAGHQPMARGGSGVIIYNGEVYNYLEIRRELEQAGLSFSGHSDTEVVLAALHHWGVEEALNRFNGMWAFAWLDLEKQCLVLARDRFGIKPLYYYQDGNALYFASELKTLLAMAPRKFDLNDQTVGEYLVQSLAEVSEQTYFKGINKLPPGHFAQIDLNQPGLTVNIKPYWHLPDSILPPMPEEELAEQVRSLFYDAVNLRMRSDVPVGVLLSGGIDSSSIAAVMHSILGQGGELNLLSATSTNSSFDESRYIDIMARHLGRPAHKVVLDLTPSSALSLLEETCWYNDEPVGSFSNAAHYLLMQKAKDLGITVILSGQGADELLCGYRKYLGFYIQSLLGQGRIFSAARLAGGFLKRGTIIKQFSLAEGRRYLPFSPPSAADIRGERLAGFAPRQLNLQGGRSLRERQVLDLERFSVPVLTHYEDRMSMACSREIRVPFLDYRLVDLFINLPTALKLKGGWTKYIFRKAMEPLLPPAIAWRKDKQGFVNPQSEWIKHELKDAILGLFGEDALIFKYRLVKRQALLENYHRYCRQAQGRGSIWFRDIFNPLALEIWLRKYAAYLS